MVSILIAARNEEKNIINCLQAIAGLSYPASGLEVLIGDDHSEDQTAFLARQFIQDKPHFKIIHITHTIGKAKGKANVLAQLALQAKGDFLFITDADVQVPPRWIETMMEACLPDTGIVTGTTLVKGPGVFNKLQSLDWLFALGLIHLASTVNIPVTVLGNNMLVTKQAYLATGGYENMPFSVTEDFVLLRAVIQRGFGFVHVVQAYALAFTEPAANLGEWLQQRKRWMRGAFQLPLYLVMPLLLQALLLPLLIGLFFFFPWLTAGIFGFKTVLQAVILLWMIYKLKYFQLLPFIFLFEPYFTVVSFAGLVYYLWPGKIVWKGRKY